MRIKLCTVLLVILILSACAGGTRGTGALLDRKLVETKEEPPKKKEIPLLNRWFGWDCGDENLDGVDDCNNSLNKE
jgi:hypothetical protein